MTYIYTWLVFLIIPHKKCINFITVTRLNIFEKGDIKPTVVLVLGSKGLLYKVMEFKVLPRDLYYEPHDKPSQ